MMAMLGYSVIAVDISPTAIDYAKAKINDELDITFICEDVIQTSVEDGCVGFITDRSCFHHIVPEERAQYAEEVRRLLCSGGKLLLRGNIKDNPPFFFRVDQDEINKYFSEEYFYVGVVAPVVLYTGGVPLDSNMVVITKK